jgi:hypothetical protein
MTPRGEGAKVFADGQSLQTATIPCVFASLHLCVNSLPADVAPERSLIRFEMPIYKYASPTGFLLVGRAVLCPPNAWFGTRRRARSAAPYPFYLRTT